MWLVMLFRGFKFVEVHAAPLSADCAGDAVAHDPIPKPCGVLDDLVGSGAGGQCRPADAVG
jgi:hypothetical protein